MNHCILFMRHLEMIIVALPLGIFAPAMTLAADTAAPVKIEESTPEQDKASARAASTDADQWAATHANEAPKPAEAPANPTPPVVDTTTTQAPPQAQAAAPTAVPEPSKPPQPPPPLPAGLNEMRGKLESKSDDPKTIRLTVDGGYNVEFSYDAKTVMINGGNLITIDDLNYGDELIIRYSGKELKAVGIDRVNKAPRPQ